jgi:tetratricopeptide (TPR) repeat protein
MKRIAIFLLIALILAFPSRAEADVAPPQNPPGTNPQPGEESTMVRMAAETVLIEIKDRGELGQAHVTADFTMRNMGSNAELLAVRFPITANDGFGAFPELKNLLIRVDDKQVSHRRVNYPEIRYQMEDVPWAEFDVNFPPNQDVMLQVAYDLDGSGYWPNTAFYYLLHTGAGWYDTIGSADIVLRLPYPATPQNVILQPEIGWSGTTPGGIFEGNEVRWRFEDFEPGPEGPVADMEFELISPRMWNSILKERANTAGNPNDGEAWGRLAKNYKDAFFYTKGYRFDPGGEELYRSSVEAYEKCLSLKPNDAQWHAGFADLLASRSYWDSWLDGATPDTFRALEEIRTALELAPNDPVVLEIAERIQYSFPEGMTVSDGKYDYPWLTQTPTPVPPTPTIIPAFDPQTIRGIYRGEEFTRSDGKSVRISLTLGSNYAAEMETQVEDEAVIITTGTWLDQGDGTLWVTMDDEYGRKFDIVFNVEGNSLLPVQYPASYEEAGLELSQIEPSGVQSTPTPQEADSPSSSAPFSLCGTAIFAPLALLIWIKRKHEQEGSK